MQQSYTIRELAQEFGITARTMRHYEELGLLAPARRGQARVYSAADRTRLKLIVRGKRLGQQQAATGFQAAVVEMEHRLFPVAPAHDRIRVVEAEQRMRLEAREQFRRRRVPQLAERQVDDRAPARLHSVAAGLQQVGATTAGRPVQEEAAVAGREEMAQGFYRRAILRADQEVRERGLVGEAHRQRQLRGHQSL